jgi:hypothetical protein
MYAETTDNPAAPAGWQGSTSPSQIAPVPPLVKSAPNGHEALSPSLRPWIAGGAAAFEMKFLLDEAQAREVERLIAGRLAPDPHGEPALGNAYRIATIYCDTPEFDVFHRLGPHHRRKYRLRRYGDESLIYLERKMKRGERVRKRRSTIDRHDLAALSGFSTDAEWPGNWFHRQLVRRRLEPVCCVRYLRTAYVGTGDEGPLRLTFDRHVRGTLVRDWELNPTSEGAPVWDGLVVCEFKFRGSLPGVFKSAIEALALAPSGASKYRHCFQAAGGGTSGSPAHA